MGEEKNRDRIREIATTIFCIAFGILVIISLAGTIQTKAAKTYSSYVTGISVRQSGRKVTVSYIAKEVPRGATCYIGYETPGGYYSRKQQIGKKGKHTVSWNTVGGVSRIYTELIARNYKKKDTVKKIYHVTTGTKYHQVTKKEELAGKIGSLAIGAGISVITMHPAFATHSVKVFLAGNTTNALLTFKYTPEYPQYIKMTTSFDKRKENLRTTVTVYTHKGGKKLKKWTGCKHIGF